MEEKKVAFIEAENMTEKELALSKTVSEIEAQAGAFVISNEDEYKLAAEFGRLLKQRSADVKEFWKPMKDAAHKAHAEICSKEKTMLGPLVNAEKILKKTMGNYVVEQDRKRREAEELAKQAAAAEMERKIQEAIEAEASGDAEAMEAAIEEAEIMNDASASICIAEGKPKAEGVSSRKDWEIVSIDSKLVPTEVAGVEIRPVDESAVIRLIRASKGQINIEGITYREVSKIAFRK